jgi:CelD/BcsL family acetyltransferase involved in cellulose biosynthesis
MLDVREVTNAAGFAALEPTWRALFEASAHATPFQSWEWVASWWKHLGRGRPWVLVAHRDGEPVALCALVITRYRGTPLRQVRFMGAPLSDFQDIIGAAEHLPGAARAFLDHIARRKPMWDVCDLNDLREGSAVPSQPAHEHLRAETVFHRMCPVIPLGATWDGFVKSLGKNMRSNVGRRRRQLEKAFATEFDLATAETLSVALDELFQLHNGRWRKRGTSGAFADSAVQAFHREVAPLFLARGWLRLHRMRLDGETRAAFYCFAHRGRIFYYLSGFDDGVGKFSPGMVLMGRAVEHAISEGATAFELLRGDETYKYAWRAEDRSTVRLILGHGGLFSHLATDGHALERFIEHQGLKVQRWLWGRRPATVPGQDAS